MNKQLTDPTKKASNIPYLVVVVLMFLISVTGAVTIEYLRPDKDNSALLIQIFGFATMITPVIMTFMQTRETHKMVNSDLAKWIDTAIQRAFIEGEKKGMEKANARTDKLNAGKKK